MTPTPSTAPEVMDVPQLAAYLGVSRSKTYAMIGTYDGPPFSRLPGRCKRFRKAAVDQWLRAREVRCAYDERRLLDGRRKRAA